MGITNSPVRQLTCRRIPALIASLATAGTVLYAHTCAAAEWEIKPSLSVLEGYTDNIRLAPDNAAEADFITEVSPGILLSMNTRALKANVRYALQEIGYARSTSHIESERSLAANGTAELVENLFFVDGSANIGQQNLSMFGPQAANNLTLTGNRAEFRTRSISPYLKHRFADFASTELRYSRAAVTATTTGLTPDRTDSVNLKVDSGDEFRSVQWSVQHDKQRLDYDSRQISFQTTEATLRYFLTPRFSLNGTGGYEKDSYASVGDMPQGALEMAGFTWVPSPRTHIDISLGHRFYGRTADLAASWRGHESTWSLGYHENVTTSAGQLLLPPAGSTADFLNQLWENSIPDAQARQQAIDSFISNNGLPSSLYPGVTVITNRVFLQKSLQAAYALTGIRNTVMLTAFSTLQRAQSKNESDTALLDENGLLMNANSRRSGVNAVLSRRLTPLVTANFSMGLTRAVALSTEESNRVELFRAGLMKQIRPKINGMIEWQYQRQHTNGNESERRQQMLVASLFFGL